MRDSLVNWFGELVCLDRFRLSAVYSDQSEIVHSHAWYVGDRGRGKDRVIQVGSGHR